jgi:hypothetical protein
MSWSISFVGKPEKVAEAVEQHGGTLSGQSKEEYEAAAPHLAALVRQNFAEIDLLIQLDANGSGQTIEGKPIQGTVSANLRFCYTKILI